jgi:hypothetical protein
LCSAFWRSAISLSRDKKRWLMTGISQLLRLLKDIDGDQ